jgi:choline dehydrogenase-like flavoprotein
MSSKMPIFDVGTLPRSHVWHILDVMRKSSRGVQWTALLIDVDPDDFVNWRCDAGCSCWLDLGRHKSRDDAWDAAEQMIATRH